MEPLQEKLFTVIRSAFESPDTINVVSGSWDTDDPTYVVFVISDKFEDMDGAERQRMAWEPLKNGLTTAERSRIAIVITSTQAEEEFIQLVKE